jgi:uncharacterized membrane protein
VNTRVARFVFGLNEVVQNQRWRLIHAVAVVVVIYLIANLVLSTTASSGIYCAFDGLLQAVDYVTSVVFAETSWHVILGWVRA